MSEVEVVEALRARDAAAFRALVEREHATLVAVARRVLLDDSVAEDVAQEAWLVAIRTLDRFEGRSALRTWLIGITLRIATRLARRQAQPRELAADPSGPTVDPHRFLARGRWAGHWAEPVASWTDPTTSALLDRELTALVRDAADRLPQRQRLVLTLRDVLGMSSEDVCDLLSLTPQNQRVILHRARAAVRTQIESYLRADDPHPLSREDQR